MVVSSNPSDGLSTIPTDDWELNPVRVDCGKWSHEVDGTTKKHTLNMQNKWYPWLTAQVEVECRYPKCSNFAAEQIKAFTPTVKGK